MTSHVVQTLGSENALIPYQDYVVDLASATTDVTRLMLTILRYSGAMGNTIFFVCSAWFLLDSRKTNVRKMLGMVMDIWTVSVVICAVVFILRAGDLPTKTIIAQFLPTTFSNNWYLTCYLVFYPIHPFLNQIIQKVSQRSLFRISTCMTFFYICFAFVLGGYFYYSNIVLWITIYFDIAYLRLYLPELCRNKKLNLGMLFGSVAGSVALILFTNLLGLKVNYFSTKLLHWNGNCNPFQIITAVSALNLAVACPWSNRIINYISKLSLLIYVIHENVLLRRYYRPLLWHWVYVTYGYEHILLWVAALVALVFLFGFLASILYKLTLKRAVDGFANWSYPKLTVGWQKLEGFALKLH